MGTKELEPFDIHQDPSLIAVQWKKWIRSFQYFLSAKGITATD
jgi:hypothetical protein